MATGMLKSIPQRSEDTLIALVDRLLDKGLVINADIAVSLAGVELLGIKLRAALASFETAAHYGLEFPSGTNTNTAAWKATQHAKDSCPQCGKQADRTELLNEGCPWCGWLSARALQRRNASSPQLEAPSQSHPI